MLLGYPILFPTGVPLKDLLAGYLSFKMFWSEEQTIKATNSGQVKGNDYVKNAVGSVEMSVTNGNANVR